MTARIDQEFHRLFWPLAGASLVHTAFLTLSSLYAAHFVGATGLAAVAACAPLATFTLALGWGWGVGTSVVIAQAVGRQDAEAVWRVARSALMLSLAVGTVLSVFGSSFVEEFVRRTRVPEAVRHDALSYGRALILVSPIQLVYLTLAAISRGITDARTPLKGMLAALAAAALSGPPLVAGWGTVSGLGASGGAIAQGFGYAVACAWIFKRVGLNLTERVRVEHHFTRRAVGEMRLVAWLGLPTTLYFGCSSVAELGLLTVVNPYGSHAAAAWGAVSQVLAYLQVSTSCVAITISLLAARAWGAQSDSQFLASVQAGLRLNLVITGTLVAAVMVSASAVGRLFSPEERLVNMIAALVRVAAWGHILLGTANVFSNAMRAGGTVLLPTAIWVACALLLAPFAWLLHQLWGFTAIWAAYPTAHTCAALLLATYFHLHWWPRHRALLNRASGQLP